MQSREIAIKLRKSGKTYSEIQMVIGPVSKSTLSYWFRNINPEDKKAFKLHVRARVSAGRTRALLKRKISREEHFKKIVKEGKDLYKLLADLKAAKLVLATLYLAEGSKKRHGSLVFGNSDPGIISLFMRLVRKCYFIDENKFRCTVQCRSGQNTKELEKFWSRVTGVNLNQFYKARVDPRSLGKVMKHPEYKGVCRVDYFSANVYNELSVIGQVLTGP